MQPNLKKQPIEWQTLGLFGGVYLGFILLTTSYHWLPWWVVLVAGAGIVALYGSLQHEVIHGHPTRWRLVNEALVFPTLWLWLPYALYRDSHLQHHKNELITDPFNDPESYYVPIVRWQEMSKPVQSLYLLRNTLIGRLLIGPLWVVVAFLIEEGRLCLKGKRDRLRVWGIYLLPVAATLWWLNYCEIPLLEYVLLVVYPGLALTLLRSFLEHQAVELPEHRTVVVSSGALFSLLFLNNNLHALHHEQPAIPWYELPTVWKANKAKILARNGGYYYNGYRTLFKRYLFKVKTHPRHPEI